MLDYVIEAAFEKTTTLFHAALDRLKPPITMTSRHEGFYTVKRRFLFLKLDENIKIKVVQRGMFVSAISVDEEKLAATDRTQCRSVFSRLQADIKANLHRD